MKVIGVIGGSGSGKTEFCRVAKEIGAFVIDGDKIAHEVLQKTAYDEVVEAFGTAEREGLRDIVFGDPSKLAELMEITYKYIEKSIANMIEVCDNDVIVIDAAQLHRTNIKCDEMVAIVADDVTTRIVKRDNIDEDRVMRRLGAQTDDYAGFADVVIENNGTYSEFIKTAREFWREKA